MSEEPDVHKVQLPPTATIHDAMRIMTTPPASPIVLVTDPKKHLLGVVVDFDLRKAMLRGYKLDAPLAEVMNPHPFTLPYGMGRDEIEAEFRKTSRASMPLVDDKGRVRGLALIADYLGQSPEWPNWVILMVGGVGKRLHPLTQDRPKPLLPIGNKPILDTIIEQFIAAGFRRFILAINRHANQFRAHFGDGSRFGAVVRYVQESRPLGTAGPLSLLPGSYRDPLIVMNGDLLTKIDLKSLLEFHNEGKQQATICVREYDFQVPYGVIQMDGHYLTRIAEKPTHRFFVNAGIYVLNPSALRLVPKGRAYDMPSLIEKVRRRGRRAVGCFPIREYWIDIGRLDDYKRAQNEFNDHFGGTPE